MNKIAFMLSCAAVTGASATAGTVSFQSLSVNSAFLTDYANVVAPGAEIRVNRIASATSTTMEFNAPVLGFGNDTFSVSASATTGNFYLGDVASLYGGNNANWFDGGGASRPDDGTIVLAFGNTQSNTSADEVVLDFNPGVTAFGFNYDDLEPATLTVVFRDAMDGTLSSQDIDANSAQGFISFVASAGETIESIVLRQNSGASFNDGFTFYDFQTLTVVPLPAPVFAGLGLLGGMSVVRRIRRG